MFIAKLPVPLTRVGLVVIPIGMASMMTGAAMLVAGFSDRWAIGSPGALMIGAILICAATLLFLVRSGIAVVDGFEAREATDLLTRLPNRLALREYIDRLSKGDQEVALAMIDFNGFKQVNDHYGQAVGDQLIEKCAQMIRAVCGKEARCYRLGGDEFAAVMTGKVADKIRSGIATGEFQLAYQPLVSAENDRIVTVEALLRWGRGNRPPLGAIG